MDAALARSYEALNEAFDRIFVLTLARATDRHRTFAKALAGLRYEIVHGQDKRDLDLAELERRGVYDDRAARRADRYGRSMTLGQIACNLSHARIWRRMLDEGLERVLVFEDDAEPIAGDIALAPAALSQLPSTFEVVYLGYQKRERATFRRRIDQGVYAVLGALGLHHFTAREALNLLPRPHSANLRRAGYHDHTHAYGFTRSAARKLLAAQTPVTASVDTAIARLVIRAELEAYVSEPKLFRQREGRRTSSTSLERNRGRKPRCRSRCGGRGRADGPCCGRVHRVPRLRAAAMRRRYARDERGRPGRTGWRDERGGRDGTELWSANGAVRTNVRGSPSRSKGSPGNALWSSARFRSRNLGRVRRLGGRRLAVRGR